MCGCGVLRRAEVAVVAELDDESLSGLLAGLQVLKAGVAAVEARLVVELGRRGDRTTLGQAVGRIEAGRIVRRAELLEVVPDLAEALAGG